MNAWQYALLTFSLATLVSAEEAEQVAPFYSYEHVEYYDDGDPYGLELRRPKIEEDTPTKRHTRMGNADVTVEVKNIERLSESEQQGSLQKKKKTEEKKSSRFHEDREEKKEESDNPEASISIKWKVGY